MFVCMSVPWFLVLIFCSEHCSYSTRRDGILYLKVWYYCCFGASIFAISVFVSFTTTCGTTFFVVYFERWAWSICVVLCFCFTKTFVVYFARAVYVLCCVCFVLCLCFVCCQVVVVSLSVGFWLRGRRPRVVGGGFGFRMEWIYLSSIYVLAVYRSWYFVFCGICTMDVRITRVYTTLDFSGIYAYSANSANARVVHMLGVDQVHSLGAVAWARRKRADQVQRLELFRLIVLWCVSLTLQTV